MDSSNFNFRFFSKHVLSFSIEDTLRGSWRRRCPSLLVGTLLVHFINGSTQRERKIMSKLYLKISSDVSQRTTTVILLQGFNVCIIVYSTCLALYTILQRWFIVHIMVYLTCLSLYTILLGWFIVYIIVYLTCLSLYIILLGVVHCVHHGLFNLSKFTNVSQTKKSKRVLKCPAEI